MPTDPTYCLTIAGLDPICGAGMAADLHVFQRLETYGLAAITAVTAQNTGGVVSFHPVENRAFSKQLEAILADFNPHAAKTGQIPTREIARIVARFVRKHPMTLVVDPVMAPTAGLPLVEESGVDYMIRHFYPLARILTPNLTEASRLANMTISAPDEMERAARVIVPGICPAVVVTGGDTSTETASDLFYDGKQTVWLHARRRNVGPIHGTGCHFSAALCAYLALGMDLLPAVRRAKRFLTGLIDRRTFNPNGRMNLIRS